MIPIKSKGVAYILWFFLGIFGAHRFYNVLYKMPIKTNKTFFVN
jgi:hypothetical protein